MHDYAYDSTADTLKHSLRVGELMGQPITELVQRSVHHDLSKTEDPELAVYNEFVPRLKASTFGSDEHTGFVAAMGEGLAHHYSANRHHAEHFVSGVTGMTLVDLIEMLADWKAATEREADGDLARSLEIQQQRYGIDDQLAQILANTAAWFGWLPPGPGQPLCGVKGRAPDGTQLVCDRPAGPHRDHVDGRSGGGQLSWVDGQVATAGEWPLAGELPAQSHEETEPVRGTAPDAS